MRSLPLSRSLLCLRLTRWLTLSWCPAAAAALTASRAAVARAACLTGSSMTAATTTHPHLREHSLLQRQLPRRLLLLQLHRSLPHSPLFASRRRQLPRSVRQRQPLCRLQRLLPHGRHLLQQLTTQMHLRRRQPARLQRCPPSWTMMTMMMTIISLLLQQQRVLQLPWRLLLPRLLQRLLHLRPPCLQHQLLLQLPQQPQK